MNNQSNNDYDKDLSWSENPASNLNVDSENDYDDDAKKGAFAGLVKTASMVIFALALLVFVGLAWFTMNENVGTNGMGVRASSNPFELEVRGTAIENSSVMTGYDPFMTEFSDGVRQTEGGLLVDKYRTDNGHESIIWRKGSLGPYSQGLMPGSSGTLTFYVIPNQTGVLDIDFLYHIRGFYAYYQGETLSEIIEITDELTDDPSEGISDADSKKAAWHYSKGHILFFKDFEDGYYSGFCGSDAFHFEDFIEEDDKTVTKDVPYEVTVHWIWVNDFVDMVAFSNSEFAESPLFSDGNTTDRGKMLDFLKDTTNNKVFHGLTSAQIAEDLAYIEANPTSDSARVTELTNAYDNADFEIGSNVNYILLEMDTSQDIEQE